MKDIKTNPPMKSLKTIFLSIAVGVLTSCSVTHEVQGIQAEAAEQIKQHRKEAVLPNPVVVRSEATWIGQKEIPRKRQVNPVLQQNLTFNSNGAKHTIFQIVRRITDGVGVRAFVDPDVSSTSGSNSDSSISAGTESVPDSFGLSGATYGNGADQASKPLAITYDYQGTVDGFLDLVASRFGIHWRYERDSVIFSRRTSQPFQLLVSGAKSVFTSKIGGSAQLGDVAVQSGSSVTSGQSSSGGSGGVNQSFEVSETSDLWADYVASVRGLLSPVGELIESPGVNTITVKDVPYVIHEVEQYVAQRNVELSRMVVVKVTVITTQKEFNSSYGTNLDAIFSGSEIGVSLTTPDFSDRSLADLATTIADPDSQFNGSKAIIKALDSRNQLASVRSVYARLINHKPTPVFITTSRGYLKSVSTTATGLDNVQQELIPGSITTGIVLNLKSQVLPGDDKILMNVVSDISSFRNFTSETSGGNSIRIPNWDQNSSVNDAIIRSGKTIVMAGIEDVTASLEAQGLGHADNVVMGGKVATVNKSDILILLEPIVVGI